MESNEQPALQQAPKSFWDSFLAFLRQYSVIGLAIGVVIGTAVNELVQSLVKGVMTPLIGLLVPQQKFQALTFSVRAVDFRLGDVVSSLLHFVIVALLIYFVVKKLLRRDELLKK